MEQVLVYLMGLGLRSHGTEKHRMACWAGWLDLAGSIHPAAHASRPVRPGKPRHREHIGRQHGAPSRDVAMVTPGGWQYMLPVMSYICIVGGKPPAGHLISPVTSARVIREKLSHMADH